MRQAQAAQAEDMPWLLAGLAMPAGLSHQLQAEPKTEQSDGEDSVGWSCVGQPVGDIAAPLYRKAELCTAPGIQGTRLKAAHLAAARLQQRAAQGFKRDCYWVSRIENKPLNCHSHY